jgi:hypothetical protein
MATNNKINISELDFNDIKTSLKTYLKEQDQFTDYDFDGSAINVLLDILAYNTHYNAMYTNLAINEMFLDSASKRDSVVSIANNYGYLPVSRTCAKATINMAIALGSSTSTSISVAKYSPFTSTVNGVEYKFYTLSEHTAISDGTNYTFTGINLYEGTPVTEKFTVFTNSLNVLQNKNIDVNTIRVTVQDISTSFSSSVYTYSEKITTLVPTSKSYFIKETEGGKYEIYFGKDNLGKEPGVGSVVIVEYMVTNGEVANGLSLFTYSGANLPSQPVITVISAATNGREAETIDEIKYNVSHKFKTQDRAVTANDYIDIIRTAYPDIDAINCWGGEKMSPPMYGKIYISIKPKTSLFLTPSEKNYITESIIAPKSMLGVSPVLLDPIYTNVYVNTTIYYDPALTNKSSSQLRELVRQAIVEYNDTKLQDFNNMLRYSRLVRIIDDADISIINNITTIEIRRIVDVIFNINARYKIDMGNPIYFSGVPEEAVMTNGFYIDNTQVKHYIDDDAAGNLRLFYYNEADYTKVFKDLKIGTVEYDTGFLDIPNIFISGVVESDLEIIIKPQSNDVVSKHNQIVDINTINITMSEEITGSTHKFASSRT